MSKKFEKMVAKDAAEYMAAEMAYGDGSGTRRKLVKPPIHQKMETLPGYEEAFVNAYNNLNMDKFAKASIKERKNLDRAAKAGQNIRAIKNGNLNNLTAGAFIIAGVVTIAHQTGYDKVVEAKAKELYKRAKVEVKFRWMRAQGRNVERIF